MNGRAHSSASAFALCAFAIVVGQPAHAQGCSRDTVLERALSFAIGAEEFKANDRQIEPPTVTGSSAALTDSPRQTGGIAAALQQGLVKRSSGGAIAISLAPFAWLSTTRPTSAFDPQAEFDRYDRARRLTGSLTLGAKGDAIDSDGDGEPEAPAEAESLGDSIGIELQYRFGSRDRRDYAIPGALLEDAKKFIDTLNENVVVQNLVDSKVERLDPGEFLDDAPCSALARDVARTPGFSEVREAYGAFAKAIEAEQHRIDTSWIVSLAATALERKDYLGPDKYAVALRGLKGIETEKFFKFNLELGRIEHAGTDGRSVDSAKLAAEYSRPALQSIDLGGGTPTFSAALAVEKYRHVPAPAPTSVATLGMKWVFPIAKGISIPLSISWANHTALLKDADEVYGHVGISLDLDQLDKL